ncbi:cobalt-precorrin-6A reductase [Saccharothrix coeruleofusca]|uniref:Precorrin-6A reductase n=1 Tax=Saccharothrix coeruleofusca TaxID=33919 RepID=A0A918AR74_9PSEU|nr:cobalt-precorrin-6A reductase [Saccharothrix coeruleofusca]MBP2335251.1 precorrin-6A/cobalt-precorrin-6A reductase [Saccharothrix coeruleofusca]GGP71783.1 precorrin-6A reductase [Saccharothrix coeruleofusca]
MRTVLVLGGTGEARALAAALRDVRVISSLAGRVANPRLPVGEVRVGGFGGVPGLVAYLRAERVDAVVDATHPFAGRITANAAAATAELGLPLLVLRRPGWTPEEGDRWTWVDSVPEAARAVAGRRAFITTGRQELAAFTGGVARTVDPPDPPVPGVEVLLDRGPYTVAGELDLMRRHRVEVLVTKDSGGPMTGAKLVAARHLGLPVVLVRRPPLPSGVPVAETVAQALAWLTRGSGAG